jgi:catechol 2,3-dioxygenase-like lactoylglutathione lyase family enzyme
MPNFFGFDHIDTRVRSIAVVEPFYDRLMPELGLPEKLYSHVDAAGEWHEPTPDRPYNTVEYCETPSPGVVRHFIGFIQDTTMTPVQTRIAFRADSRDDLERWHRFLSAIGALRIERSTADDYPAIFFEDPAGTKLEIVARVSKTV